MNSKHRLLNRYSIFRRLGIFDISINTSTDCITQRISEIKIESHPL
ncbi:MAG: hypothetical protein ACRC4L_01285 [Mycoplasma sp.]